MFEPIPAASPVSDVRAWTEQVASLGRGLDDADRIDLIRALEELTCAAAAAQAVVSADFDASQRAHQASRGVPAAGRGRGVAAQIALARRESPHRAQQHLGLAKILRAELPETMRAFRAGRITEWKATLVARETACLRREDRAAVDAELAGNPDRIEAMGDGEVVTEARRLAYRLDPSSFVERRRRAEAERRVTLRPAPDVMCQLSALLPVKAGVAVYAVLSREADRLRAAGDPRSRGQLMADVLLDRVVSPRADDTTTKSGPAGALINLTVSDDVLFGDSDEAGHVDGYGPVPADLARELAFGDGLDDRSRRWFRRLYTDPATGSLVAMDSTARLMPRALAGVLRLRDRTCRTPWCDAPIRHSDHVRPVLDGGETSERNGQGLCEACNHAKQAPGWRAGPAPGIRHTVETVTPTGHTHRSAAPPIGHAMFREDSPGRWVLVA